MASLVSIHRFHEYGRTVGQDFSDTLHDFGGIVAGSYHGVAA
jgi:hypothetical protein